MLTGSNYQVQTASNTHLFVLILNAIKASRKANKGTIKWCEYISNKVTGTQ